MMASSEQATIAASRAATCSAGSVRSLMLRGSSCCGRRAENSPLIHDPRGPGPRQADGLPRALAVVDDADPLYRDNTVAHPAIAGQRAARAGKRSEGLVRRVPAVTRAVAIL